MITKNLLLLGFIVLSTILNDTAGQNEEGKNLIEPNPKIFRAFKSIVNYLGTDFFMYDGCPIPDCNRLLRRCNNRRSKIIEGYYGCSRSDVGDLPGCITDVLPNNSNITVPIFAKYCSAACYIAVPSIRRKIHPCPYQGVHIGEVDSVTNRLLR